MEAGDWRAAESFGKNREHFSVDGTLVEAWVSHKSFRPKDESADDGDGSDFRGKPRRNDTHESKTDPVRGSTARHGGQEARP